ncbi:MAG: hypothetical protein KAV00_12080 [Phycisphaerae bacterium]|nr:hypothetical protein [Phycisphaerae bacterium]
MRKKEWGIAFVVVVVSIGLYFAVRGLISPAEPTYLKRIHDKLANGQPYLLSRGREISAEVVYFDSNGSLVLDSKDEEHGVVFTNKARPNSKVLARHARLKVVEPTTLKLEMEDVVIETKGSGTTQHAEKMSMTMQLP